MGAQTGTCPFHRGHRAEYRRDITSLFSPSPSPLIIFMMLVLRDTRRFFETTELPSPTPHVDPGADQPVLIFNHQPTLLGLMISFMVWRLAFPSSPPPLGILMAFIRGVEGDTLCRSSRGSVACCGCILGFLSSARRAGMTYSLSLPWYAGPSIMTGYWRLF